MQECVILEGWKRERERESARCSPTLMRACPARLLSLLLSLALLPALSLSLTFTLPDFVTNFDC